MARFYDVRGFGRAFGDTSIVGSIGFAEQWSADDWTKNSWNPDYQVPNLQTLADAQSKWQQLSAVKDQSDAARIIYGLYLDRIANAAALVDQYTRAHYYGQGMVQAENRMNAYYALTSIMRDLANVIIPDPQVEQDAQQAAEDAAAAKAAADTAAKLAAAADAAAKLKKTQAAIDAAKQAAAQAAIAAAAAKAHTQAAQQKAALVKKQSSAALSSAGAGPSPVLLGLLGVAVLGAGYFALRSRKAASTAGYRRRKR